MRVDPTTRSRPRPRRGVGLVVVSRGVRLARARLASSKKIVSQSMSVREADTSSFFLLGERGSPAATRTCGADLWPNLSANLSPAVLELRVILHDRDLVEPALPRRALVREVVGFAKSREDLAHGRRMQRQLRGHPGRAGPHRPRLVVRGQMEPDVHAELRSVEPPAEHVLDQPLADGRERPPAQRRSRGRRRHSRKLSTAQVS